MRRLTVFNQITLDGYFTSPDGDIGWAHRASPDAEWSDFVAGNARSGGVLLFGRVTYDMMASYWPTPAALANDPVVAERMNALPKVVFSRTMDRAAWSNTTLVRDDIAGAVRTMKREPGEDLVILGSGSIVSQLARTGLIDAFQFVVNPVVLGRGRTMFDGLDERLGLRLSSTRAFHNGNVLLCYERSA